MAYVKSLIDHDGLKKYINQHITNSHSGDYEYLQLFLSVYELLFNKFLDSVNSKISIKEFNDILSSLDIEKRRIEEVKDDENKNHFSIFLISAYIELIVLIKNYLISNYYDEDVHKLLDIKEFNFNKDNSSIIYSFVIDPNLNTEDILKNTQSTIEPFVLDCYFSFRNRDIFNYMSIEASKKFIDGKFYISDNLIVNSSIIKQVTFK